MKLGWFGVPPLGGSTGSDRLKPRPQAVRAFMVPMRAKNGLEAFHEPRSSRRKEANFFPAQQSEPPYVGCYGSMLVFDALPAGLQKGEQVENLLFRQRVQQTDRHQGRTLRLPPLNLGFPERLDEGIRR